MPEMEMDSQLLRAMSTIGGRTLLKSTETLAASIVRLNPGSKTRSNARELRIIFEKDSAVASPMPEKPVLQGDYYAYENGTVLFKGNARALHKIKATLFQLAKERKPYLLGMYGPKHLERYGLTISYIDALEDKVEKLAII